MKTISLHLIHQSSHMSFLYGMAVDLLSDNPERIESAKSREMLFYNDWEYKIVLTDKGNKLAERLLLKKISTTYKKCLFMLPSAKMYYWCKEYLLRESINKKHDLIFEYIVSLYGKRQYDELSMEVEISDELYYIFHNIIKEANEQVEELKNLPNVKKVCDYYSFIGRGKERKSCN